MVLCLLQKPDSEDIDFAIDTGILQTAKANDEKADVLMKVNVNIETKKEYPNRKRNLISARYWTGISSFCVFVSIFVPVNIILRNMFRPVCYVILCNIMGYVYYVSMET